MYNLARFDFVSIRLAVSCAQSGSLTAAARVSNLALAAASRRIRELESALGQSLFERHAKGLAATEAGRVFVRHGLTVLQTMDSLGTELADQRDGYTRHVRLCASTAAINQFLPELLATFAGARPQVRVDLEEQVSDAVVLALREGRADVGILVEGPDTTGLEVNAFRSDVLALILPQGHRLAADKTPIAFSETLEEDMISLNAGAAMLQKQQQCALAAGKPLRLRMQVRSFDAVCHLVASMLVIAVLPIAAVRPLMRSMSLTARPLSDGWARRRILVARQPGAASREAEDLVSHLIESSQNANARSSNGK